MASRTRHLRLASVFAALVLVGASGAGLTRSVTASPEPLACDSGVTACFDIVTDGANITHVFVDSGCAASPSEYLITVDGVPVLDLHTEDGPCESLPREVWFPLESHQDTAQVCVSVPRGALEGLRVYAKAGDACLAGTMP